MLTNWATRFQVSQCQTWYHIRYAMYGFLLVCYSNFIPTTHHIWDNIQLDRETRGGSFKVIGIDADRSATYDFLLTFHSNHGPISYRFWDKRRFQSKIAKFSHPPCILRPAERVPLGIVYRRCESKPRIGLMMLQGRERSLAISSALWIQYTNVTDGRTDIGHSVAR